MKQVTIIKKVVDVSDPFIASKGIISRPVLNYKTRLSVNLTLSEIIKKIAVGIKSYLPYH